MAPHPAPLVFVVTLLLRALSALAVSAPAKARAELAPLRLGAWIDTHLFTSAPSGPLVAAPGLAGWLTALLELLPHIPAHTQALHGTAGSLVCVSVLVNYYQATRIHAGPVEAGATAHGAGVGRCDACAAIKPARAHHCSTCKRCSLRMDQ